MSQLDRDHPRYMGPEAEELMSRMVGTLVEVERQAKLKGIRTVTDDGKAAIGSVILLLWSIGYEADDIPSAKQAYRTEPYLR